MLLEHEPCTDVENAPQDVDEDFYAHLNPRYRGSGAELLHRVVRYDDAEVAQLLLKKGANVDGRNAIMLATPLHVAAEFASVNCAELLLQYDANLNLRDTVSRTPLDTAISFYQSSFLIQDLEEREEIIEILLNAGADVNDGFYNWLTRTIAQYGHIDLLHMESAKILLKYMAKMEPYNLFIDEQNLEFIKKYDCLESFYNLCRQEISTMLQVKILSKVSLYDFMIKSTRVMSVYANDEQIMLELKKCKQQIPIYYENLEKRLKSAIDRKRLMRCASSALIAAMNYCIDEGHIVAQKILDFLSTEDLKNLITMHDP